MVFKSQLYSGGVDVSDLRQDSLIQWQHRWYVYLATMFGIVFPTIVPGFLWNDWFGGLCFSGALRLTIAHHVSVLVSVSNADAKAFDIFW
jgi:stearoyl-CoA desaturase (Delta-9 desaturase)